VVNDGRLSRSIYKDDSLNRYFLFPSLQQTENLFMGTFYIFFNK